MIITVTIIIYNILVLIYINSKIKSFPSRTTTFAKILSAMIKQEVHVNEWHGGKKRSCMLCYGILVYMYS